MNHKECVFLCKEKPLPRSEWVNLPGPNGGVGLACLHASDLRGQNIQAVEKMHGVRSPTSRMLEMIKNGSKVDQLNRPDGEGSLKVFFLYGKDASRLGIRTSQNWNETYWGMQCLSLPGYWIVPVAHLPEGVLEFKVVSQEDEGTMEWEPQPFINKKVYIYGGTQFISAEWGAADAIAYRGYKHTLGYSDNKRFQGSLIKIGHDILQVPILENRCIKILGKKREFTKMQCPNGKETMKLFFLYGKDENQLGIRSSENWNVTHWGVKLPSFPDYWIVAVSHLTKGMLDFKVVSKTQSGFDWEPFNNKTVFISAAAQIISAEWGTAEKSVFDLPLYKKNSKIPATKPKVGENDQNISKAGKFNKFNDFHPKSSEYKDLSLYHLSMDYPLTRPVLPYETSAMFL